MKVSQNVTVVVPTVVDACDNEDIIIRIPVPINSTEIRIFDITNGLFLGTVPTAGLNGTTVTAVIDAGNYAAGDYVLGFRNVDADLDICGH